MNSVSEVEIAQLLENWNSWRNIAIAEAKGHSSSNRPASADRLNTIANTYLCCIRALEDAAGVPVKDRTQ